VSEQRRKLFPFVFFPRDRLLFVFHLEFPILFRGQDRLVPVPLQDGDENGCPPGSSFFHGGCIIKGWLKRSYSSSQHEVNPDLENFRRTPSFLTHDCYFPYLFRRRPLFPLPYQRSAPFFRASPINETCLLSPPGISTGLSFSRYTPRKRVTLLCPTPSEPSSQLRAVAIPGGSVIHFCPFLLKPLGHSSKGDPSFYTSLPFQRPLLCTAIIEDNNVLDSMDAALIFPFFFLRFRLPFSFLEFPFPSCSC